MEDLPQSACGFGQFRLLMSVMESMMVKSETVAGLHFSDSEVISNSFCLMFEVSLPLLWYVLHDEWQLHKSKLSCTVLCMLSICILYTNTVAERLDVFLYKPLR